MKRAIIFRLGELDRFTVEPSTVLAENGAGTGLPVAECGNLAEAALQRSNPMLNALFAEEAEYLCCASRPRAVRALLDFAGVEYRSRTITWLAVSYDATALKSTHGTPWYPVIDRDRCTGCGVCYDYCLFGTYARESGADAPGSVQVMQPLNCKTGCPACARLCASGALIFPFAAEAALNGALAGDAPREPSDLMKAFEADPMKVLEERRRKRRLLDERRIADAEREQFSKEL